MALVRLESVVLYFWEWVCFGFVWVALDRMLSPPYNTLHFAFLDLEKAYDRVDRDAMWNVLRLYGIGGRLLRGVKSLYVGSKACVRVGNEVSEWFPVRVRLRQGCVMSPWLFNLYIDGVIREVNARVLGRGL